MNPVISQITENNSILNFTLSGVNTSIANSLRRISSEVKSVVFITTPHEKNNATFLKNTSRMNNEILKQRLSCIPIMTDTDFPIDEYILVVNKQNQSNTIEYVTTNDFKVVNIETLQEDKELTRKLFPENKITGDYIELVRLLPRISENIEGEQLSLKCKFAIASSKQDSAFNIVSTFAYGNTLDKTRIQSALTEKKTEFSKLYSSKEEIDFALRDWQLLEAKRLFVPDSFDYTVETIGQYTNMNVVFQCCELMIAKLKKLQDTIQSEQNVINASNTTIPNSFDIFLKNEDYTLGKVVEYVLYTSHYNKTLNYCGFQKPHPHIDESLIRIGFKNPTEKITVISYIVNAANDAIGIYEKISKSFDII